MPIETTTWAATVRRANEGKGGPTVHPAAGRTPLQNPPSLEKLFAEAWEQFGNGATLIPEFRFDSNRRWRFDFAIIGHKCRVAVEMDGGQWAPQGGRHNRDSDREKLNFAAADGWLVFRFSRAMIEDDPAECVKLVRRALEF